jgi:hypothetical protein
VNPTAHRRNPSRVEPAIGSIPVNCARLDRAGIIENVVEDEHERLASGQQASFAGIMRRL